MSAHDEVKRLLDRAARALEAGQYLKTDQLIAQADVTLRDALEDAGIAWQLERESVTARRRAVGR